MVLSTWQHVSIDAVVLIVSTLHDFLLKDIGHRGCRTSLADCFWSVSSFGLWVMIWEFANVRLNTHSICLPKAVVAAEKFPSSSVAPALEHEKQESKKRVEGMCRWFTETLVWSECERDLVVVSGFVGNFDFGVCFWVDFFVDVVFFVFVAFISTSTYFAPSFIMNLRGIGFIQSSIFGPKGKKACCLWSRDCNSRKPSERKKVVLWQLFISLSFIMFSELRFLCFAICQACCCSLCFHWWKSDLLFYGLLWYSERSRKGSVCET